MFQGLFSLFSTGMVAIVMEETEEEEAVEEL